MGGKAGLMSKIAAWILVTVNLIAMLISVLTFGFSLWIIISPKILSYAIDSLGSTLLSALLPPSELNIQLGLELIFLALLVFFVSYMGLYGAITRSPFQLFMYATLVLLLLLLECALFYYFSSNLVEKGLRSDAEVWTHPLRLIFSCCEMNVTEMNVAFPWSCCGAAGYTNNCTSFMVYTNDCYTTATNWLSRYQIAVYSSLALFHVILSTCSLLRRTRCVSRSHS